MNYRVEEIESQLRSSEDSGWEFKQVEFAEDRPKRPTRDDWANEIAAFANAAGGVVLAGVSDDGNVIGMSRSQIANLDALLVEVKHRFDQAARSNPHTSQGTVRRQAGAAGRGAGKRFSA